MKNQTSDPPEDGATAAPKAGNAAAAGTQDSHSVVGSDDPGGLAGIVAARTRKIESLRRLGLEPYPTKATRTHTAEEAVAAFEALEAAASPGDSGPEGAQQPVEGPHDVALAGRLVGALRHMGGSSFVHLSDASGHVQLHLRRNRMGDEAFLVFRDHVDGGDFVQATGSMFRTKMGEVSLAVDSLALVAKSLLPLPEKWHGLTDIETRYRQRYLDLIANAEVRQRFFGIAPAIVSAMRRFLDERGFLEVETPVLQPIYGGGSARPFTTYYNALEPDRSTCASPTSST